LRRQKEHYPTTAEAFGVPAAFFEGSSKLHRA